MMIKTPKNNGPTVSDASVGPGPPLPIRDGVTILRVWRLHFTGFGMGGSNGAGALRATPKPVMTPPAPTRYSSRSEFVPRKQLGTQLGTVAFFQNHDPL